MSIRLFAVSAWMAVLVVGGEPDRAVGAPIVLNCTITEGLPNDAPKELTSRPIMVDEDKGIVVYSALTPTITLPGGQVLDHSMRITTKDKTMIQANNETSVFIITKHDGRFVYSFVLAFPRSDGSILAYGNTLSGTCARNAFQ